MDFFENALDNKQIAKPEPAALEPEFKPLICAKGPFKPGSKECEVPKLNLSPISELDRAVIDRTVKELSVKDQSVIDGAALDRALHPAPFTNSTQDIFKQGQPLDFSAPRTGRDFRLNLDVGPRAPLPGGDLRLKLDRVLTFDLNLQGQPVEMSLNPRKCRLSARTGLCFRLKF